MYLFIYRFPSGFSFSVATTVVSTFISTVFSLLGHRPPPERELHPMVLPHRQLGGYDRRPDRRHDLLLAQGLQEAAAGNGQNKRAFIKAFL